MTKFFIGWFIPETHGGFQLVAVSRDLSCCMAKFFNFCKQETFFRGIHQLITGCLFCTWNIVLLNELNLSLQNKDMNILRAKQFMKAFMNKLMIRKVKAMTHNCRFPSLDCKEIDFKLQTVIGNHLYFLHDNFHARLEDLLQLNTPSFCQFPSCNDNRGCHGPT